MYVVVGAVAAAAIGYAATTSSASKQASAANKAAGLSAASARDATQLQGMMYDQTRADQQPWVSTGGGAINELAWGMGLQSNNASMGNMSDAQIRGMFAPQFGGATPNTMNVGGSNDPLWEEIVKKEWDQHVARYGIGWDGPETTGDNRSWQLQKMQLEYDSRRETPAGQLDEAGLDAAVAKYKADRVYQGQGEFGSLTKQFTMDDFEKDPGYEFRKSEGLKALDNSAASRGMLLSGSQLKGVERYGQGLASQEYQSAFDRYNANQANQYNRLGSLAGVGQTANQAVGSAGTDYANNVGIIGMSSAATQGSAALAAGQAQASAYQSYGNLAGQAAGTIANWYSQPSPQPVQQAPVTTAAPVPTTLTSSTPWGLNASNYTL